MAPTPAQPEPRLLLRPAPPLRRVPPACGEEGLSSPLGRHPGPAQARARAPSRLVPRTRPRSRRL